MTGFPPNSGNWHVIPACRRWVDAVEKWPNVIGFPIGERFGLRVILVLMGVTAGPANDRSADAI
jgi:hypothetical protein